MTKNPKSPLVADTSQGIYLDLFKDAPRVTRNSLGDDTASQADCDSWPADDCDCDCAPPQ